MHLNSHSGHESSVICEGIESHVTEQSFTYCGMQKFITLFTPTIAVLSIYDMPILSAIFVEFWVFCYLDLNSSQCLTAAGITCSRLENVP